MRVDIAKLLGTPYRIGLIESIIDEFAGKQLSDKDEEDLEKVLNIIATNAGITAKIHIKRRKKPGLSDDIISNYYE